MKQFSYLVRRSQRVKNARIVVSPAKVEVVAPLRMPERMIKQFVYERRNWVIRTLEKLDQRYQASKSLAPEAYHDGVEIPFRGGKYRLTVQTHHLKRVKIEFTDVFVAWLPESSDSPVMSELIRTALIKWMHQRAAVEAEKTLVKYTGLHYLRPRSIRIKTQKSRWGSCGIHNDINLNWVLILAPEAVFEYVLVHELCHIKHRNHSAAFWNLVAENMPDYQQHRAWLNDNGAGLMSGL